MNMKYILLVILFSWCNGFSQNVLQNSLEGLNSFYVQIIAPESLSKHGISESQIKNDVELKLRMAGITVSDVYGSVDSGSLAIFIGSTRITNGSIRSFSFQLCVLEYVKSNRIKDPLIITWMATSGGYQSNTSNVEYSTLIRDNIKDLLDYFINDYLRDNPK